MAINMEDGEFAIDCWEDPDRDDLEPVTKYSDDADELRAHAQEMVKSGKYKYVVLSEWSDEEDDWSMLEEIPDGE